MNNLKQMGLALQSHHDAIGHYPSAYVSQSAGLGVNPETLDGPNGWAWGAQILPWLEQGHLHQSLRFDMPAWHSVNSISTRSAPKVFLNPVAPNNSPTVLIQDSSGTVLAEWGRSHYVANVGQDEPWGYDAPNNTDDHWARVSTGPFYRNSKTQTAHVTDGLSTTIFLGEHTTISEKTWVAVHPQAIVAPNNPARFPFTESDRAATLVLCHSGPAADEPGVVHPPSFPTCHVCQMYAEWSSGGGHVLFGDGSVRFISTRVNLSAWAAMSSMNLGDVASE